MFKGFYLSFFLNINLFISWIYHNYAYPLYPKAMTEVPVQKTVPHSESQRLNGWDEQSTFDQWLRSKVKLLFIKTSAIIYKKKK